jgi:hypothetical protein
MDTRANYIVTGAFTLAVIVGVFGFIFWFHNSGGGGERASYRVVFAGSVSGRDATIDAYFLKDQEDAAAWVGDKPGGRLVERQRTNVRDTKEAAHDTRDAATIQKDHAKAMAALYDAHDREQAEAWRGNPPSGAGSGEFRGAQEGDICTVRGLDFPDDFGSPGHLRMRDGRLVCVPNEPQSAKKHDHAMTMDEVYRAYDLEISQRWRAS